jgi:hypothetical protein
MAHSYERLAQQSRQVSRSCPTDSLRSQLPYAPNFIFSARLCQPHLAAVSGNFSRKIARLFEEKFLDINHKSLQSLAEGVNLEEDLFLQISGLFLQEMLPCTVAEGVWFGG